MKHPNANDPQTQPSPVLQDPQHFDPDLAAYRARFLGDLYVRRPEGTRTRRRETSPTPVNNNPGTTSRHRMANPHGPFPRLVVGPDAIQQLPAELERLSLSLPLIVSNPSRMSLARSIQSMIPHLDTRILDSAAVASPSAFAGRDCVISVGGAAVALARNIAHHDKIPHICIPTTYRGTELAPTSGQSSSSSSGRDEPSGRTHGKNSRAASKMLPAVIIYDDNLTDSRSPTKYPALSDMDIMSDSDEAQQTPKDENARWGYLNLAGT